MSAMPIGEFKPCRNTCFSTDPGFDSRSSVIRLPLGCAPEPARFITSLWTLPPTPLLSSGLAGASDPATSTSPFGSTYNQRGCSSLRAKAVTVVPSAPCGFPPSFQPLAFATRTVATMDLVGATNSGDGPYSDGPYSALAVVIAARQENPAGMVNMASAVNSTRRSFSMRNHGAPHRTRDTRIHRHFLSDVS